MTNPFKKYLVELTGEETPQAIEGVSNLKRALINDKKDFTVEQLEQYDDANAFREAEGSLPTHVSDYYHNREFNQFNQAVERTGVKYRKAERDAWVDNDERDTITGRAKNLTATGLENAVRQGGFAMQAPFSTYAREQLAVPDDVLKIWERRRNGQQLTAEEEARLDEKGDGLSPEYREVLADSKDQAWSPDRKVDDKTFRERLADGEAAHEIANVISNAAENSTIFSNIRNDLDSEFFQQDMAKTAEAIAPRFRAAGQAFKEGNYGNMAGQFAMGLGEMAAGFAGDALKNPQAAFEFAAEQAPQLAAGAYSTKLLGAMNVGYASDVYREKVNKFREDNDRLPNREESSSMAGWAASTALAEQIGDVSILRTFQRSSKLSPSVTKVLKITPDAVQKVAKSGITRTAAAGAKTTAVEAGTEAYQTAVETSDISPFDGSADLEEVMVAAGLGGMVGGKIGTTGAAISNTRRALQEGKENRATRANHELTGRYAQEIAAGDRPAEDLLNEEDPRLYHPGRATAALTFRANDKNVSEEERAKASAKVNEIFDGLNQRAVELREKLENAPNKTERKKISRDLKDAEGFLEMATRGIDNVNAALKQQREADANQQEDLKTATQEEVTPESQEAAERVIHSMAFNSELYAHNTELSAKIFDELRNSPSVTEEQKQYINNIEASYTAEQALDNASKSAKAVGQDIRKGAPGFKGVLQYRRDTNRALREGNLDKAETEIETLREFARDHSKKFKQAKIALDQALESGENVYLFRNPKSDTGWEIRTKSEGSPPWNTRTQQSQVGGFTFNMRGKGARKAAQDFVNVLESEVGLINSLGKELVQAKSLASTGNTKTTTQESTESGFDESVIPETVAPPAADAGNINVNTGEETASSPGPAEAVPGTRQESESSADTASNAEPQVERRTDSETRRRADEMSPEELRAEVERLRAETEKLNRQSRIDDMTGLGNRAAFEEALETWEGEIISIDADSLKWINDNMSPETGDALLKAVGKTIKDHTKEGEGFHISGDEFYILTTQDAEPLMDQINQILADATLTRTKPDGSTITKTGLEITYGTGKDRDTADTNLKSEKSVREQRGKRAGRGKEPQGISRNTTGVSQQPESGRQADGERTRLNPKVKKGDELELSTNGDKVTVKVSAVEEIAGEQIAFHRDHKNPSIWVATEVSTGLAVVPKSGNTKTRKGLIADTLSFIKENYGEDKFSQLVEEKLNNMFPQRAESQPQTTPDTTTEAQAAPAAQEPEVVVSEQTKQETETPINIWHASNENAQLSNLASRPFKDKNGRQYLSVEHAYQSWKSGKFDQATYNKYKSAGRKIPGNKGTKTDNGWNIRLMERLIRMSFEQNTEAAQALLSTGTTPLTHKQDRGIWAKEFPRILEMVRGELRNDPQTEVQPSNESATTNVDTEVDTQTEATPIEEVGKVGTYFTQRQGKAENATSNPLTEIEDFMAQMLEAGEDLRSLVQPFLDKELTDKQIKLLGQFMNFFRAADGSLVELTSKERNPDFLHEDLTKLFGQPIPQNVRAAVTAAAFSLLIENGGKHSNTNEDINRILGRSSDHPVTSFERSQLLDPVARHNVTARKMGKRIVSFLNIQAKPDAPADKIRNLEASLGGLAITALLETDLMQKKEVKPEEITDQYSVLENEFETVNLVMLNHDSQDVRNILETTRGAGNVLGELFGIEQGTVYPPSKPGSYNAKKAIAQGVPAVLAKIMAKVSRRPQKLNAEVGNKLTQFPKEFIGKLAGIEPTEGPNVHKAKEGSIKAKNDAIERDINNWLNFRDYNGDNVFYLRPKMHSQQRVGIEHSVMDPQASKVYRHLMYPQAWETQVNPTKKSSRKLTYFKAAVAQGMGFAVDKKNLQASVDYFDQLMQDPDILAALEALQKDEPTDVDQAAILKATKKGDENLWSFHMLVEMAKFQQGANFTTNVMLEIDGVTNGPALTQAMLGTIGPWLGSKLGFMTSAVTNEGIENHTQFKEQGGRDLYETLAHLIQKQLNKTKVKTRDGMVPKDPYISRMTQDILFFTGSFSDPSGRKRAKTPITAMTFGSSESTAVNNMAEELISLYYDQIEEAWTSDNVIALEEIQYRINRIIGSKAPQVVELAEPLTRKQEDAIKKSFNDVMEPAVSAALDEQFSEMKTRRKELYMASKAMFETYRIAREYFYKQALKNSTTVRRDKNGKPIDDISTQEYAEIDRQLGKMMPKMHTAMSKLTDVTNRSAGLMLPKPKFTEADRTSPYRQNLQMLRPIKNNLTRVKGKLKESPYMRVQAESLSWEDPGVRAVVMSIHSSDSAIASLTYGEFDALNIHDALGFSLDDVFEGGQKLNQNTFRILADYSPAVELHRALDESYSAFKELAESVPEATSNEIVLENVTSKEPQMLNDEFVRSYQISAYRMEVDKLNFLLNLDKISQYSLDGTEYQVTEKDRAIIQKKLEAAQQKLRELGETDTDPTFNEPRTDIDRTANNTPWGRTGVPSKVNDMGLVEMFVASRNGGRLTVRDSVPAKEMAAKLEKRIRETGRSKAVMAFQIGLLRTAMRLINPNMEIRLIRPDTPSIDGIENLRQSVGFYHPDGWIGIKSPEFQDSMITTEMLLHELLHAATSSVMHRIRTGEETDPVAIEAYQGLENLLTKARAFVQKEGLSEFDNAVSNVDELVSWGLTNQDFQDKVLAQIQITPEEQAGLTDRIQRSGFKEFIGKIYRLVFRNKGPHQWRSGLGSLVADASILMKSKSPRAEMDSNGQPIRSMAFEQRSAYNFTPQELFDNLHDDSRPLNPERAQRLKGLLSHLVEAVFQDGAYKENVQRTTPVTAEELFIESMTDDSRVFHSDIATLMELNHQEQYVLESTELALRHTLKLNQMIFREADIMFTEMKKKGPSILVRGDWDQLTDTDQRYYRKVFDSIFKIAEDSDGRAAYLSKFLAAAMVYQPLGEAMSQTYIPKGRLNLRGLSFLERYNRVIQWFMSHLRRHVAKTRQGDDYAESTKRMILNMVRLERKRQTKLEKARKRGETGLESKFNKAADKVRSGANAVAQSPIFRNSKFTLVRFGSEAAEMTAEGRVGDFMDNLKRLRDGATNERLGIMGQSWIELRGDDDINAMLTQMLSQTKTIEQMRKRLNIEVHENVDEAFESLSDDESEALTKTLVRSGAFILMDNHSLNDILELVANQTTRRKRIKALVQQLPKKHRSYYQSQARALGIHIATGDVKSPMLMRNAYNIAHYLGINNSMPIDPDVASQAEPIIDEIATLVAIDAQGKSGTSNRNYREHTAEVMRRELNRTLADDDSNKTNGIEFLLRMHREMDKESRKSLFGNDKTQIVKGYTKDTYDPYIDVVIVKASEGEMMQKAGYKKVEHEILQDSADPRQEKLEMYVARNGGVGQHITGIMSNTDRHRQGTAVVGERRDAMGRINQKNLTLLEQIARNKTNDVISLIKGNYKPSSSNSLVPVLDTKGNIISWRYMMTEATRDKVLMRNNKVGKVMGNIASSIVDKSQTPLLNKNAVDAIKAIYEQNFVDNSDAFIEFGPKSSDTEIQERYRLLPETTKQYIREVWGRDGMMIRNDTYNILFGYRKASLKQIMEMPPEHRGMVKATLAKLMGEYELVDNNDHTIKRISSRRGKYFMQAENAWEEIVSSVKDFWVIKSFSTLVGNETSNATILYLNGVSPLQIPKLKAAAYQQTKDYIKHRQEKERLERLITLGHLSNDQLVTAQQEILHLQALMDSSPVAEVMDQGMYQTLVEDVSQEEDPYSYKSQLSNRIDNATQWVPKIARDAVKVGLMTHDTQLYKMLNDLTIMSDFTSRVVLNEHLKNRTTKQLSATERQRRVRDAFVDYDVPTSKAMQKLNDMGVVWFSKYYLRIQHVILQLVRENPIRSLQLWAIADWLWSLPDILDSTLLQKDLGNSLGTGAFEMLDAPRELITYKVADDVFFD